MLAYLPFRLWAEGRANELDVVKGEDEEVAESEDVSD